MGTVAKTVQAVKVKRKVNTFLQRQTSIVIPSIRLKAVGVHKIQDVMTCRRYYFWRWVMNLVPKKINMNFWYGNLVHKGMEFGAKRNPNMKEIRGEMLEASHENSKDYYIDHFDKQEMELMFEIAYMMIKVYIQNFDDELYKVEICGTEVKFALKLKNSPVIITGTIDAYGKMGNIYVLLEYKTGTMITDEYFARLRFDKQLNIYAYGVKSLTGKFPAFSPYLVFRKPMIRCKQNESIKQFLNRLEGDLNQRQDWYYLKDTIRFGKRSLGAVWLDVEGEVFDLNTKYDFFKPDELLNPFNWSRNDRACFNFGVCPYFMLCKNCHNYELYLNFYRMRDIRYEAEQAELDSSRAFSTEQRTTLTISKKSIASLKQLIKGK